MTDGFSETRRNLLNRIAEDISRVAADHIVRVAVDGVDGSGKTWFADELAATLTAAGRTVIRASVDGFHQPREIRYRKGRASPEGFYFDSYDYAHLRFALLDPLSPGGHRRYRRNVFDYRKNEFVQAAHEIAPPTSILIFDGIFLHRPELRAYWDYSIFLQVSFAVSIGRCAQRDGGNPDPDAAENERYVRGQELYLRTEHPARRATVVVNNDDLELPYLEAPERRA